MNAGFVFDLDGTLVDSLPGIAKGLNLALDSLGMPTHSEEQIRTMVGRGARELCKAALPETDFSEDSIKSLLAAFMREYPHTWQEGTVPYPGIKQLLLHVQSSGIPLAVLSNKPHVVTEPLVRHLFPKIDFSVVMGYSDRFPRKPDPAALLHIVETWKAQPAHVTLIGDSAHDAKTALGAHTRLILVGWGYSVRSALDAFGVPVCDDATRLQAELLPRQPRKTIIAAS